ncbi:Similar to fs(1)h: Homeotic protein female sterile (Drosophila melanogaster), partial [Cotesia congregata]
SYVIVKMASSRKVMSNKGMRVCMEVMVELLSKKNEEVVWPFYTRFDAEIMNPESKRPMNLKTVWSKLNAGEYSEVDEFVEDIRFIISSAFKLATITPKKSIWRTWTKEFQRLFDSLHAKKIHDEDLSDPEHPEHHKKSNKIKRKRIVLVYQKFLTASPKPGKSVKAFTGQVSRAHKVKDPKEIKPLNITAKNAIIEFALKVAQDKNWKNKKGVATTREELQHVMTQRLGELKRSAELNKKKNDSTEPSL